MSIKFACLMSVFNAKEEVKRALDSIIDHVDCAIVVDGKYQQFLHPDPLSTDGTRDVIKSYGSKVMLHDAPNMTEVEKRNQYFIACENLDIDYALIMDSDEYIVPELTDWPKFKEALRSMAKQSFPYLLEYNSAVYWGLQYYPRIWFKPGQWRYYQRHYWWQHTKTGIIIRQEDYEWKQNQLIPHIVMSGDRLLRPRERRITSEDYEDLLYHHEKGRARHRTITDNTGLTYLDDF